MIGKSDGKYTQKSNVVKIREKYKNLDKIENYKVESLNGGINQENSINISWNKLDKFDCTYSIYIRNNKTSKDGGFTLYQYGISDNKITIPLNEGEDVDLDIYVVANSSQGASQNSDILNVTNIKQETKPEE